MGDTMPVLVEAGPRGKRVVAIARDWPGLERGDKTEDAALERLRTYLPRYARVAELAGLAGEYAADADLAVIARYPGVGGTDFWGISFQYLSDHDREPLSADALERELALMQAAWRCFDEVRARVSPELRKGPRGGGRDRDQIVSHVFGNERDWAGGVGVQTPPGVMLTEDGLATHRAEYTAAIRAFHAEGKTAKRWPLRYLIRHTAYHTLDHAWEMEDKDLSDA